MAYSTILKHNSYQDTTIWNGNNTDPTTISGLSHQPDLVWAKARTGSYDTQNHCVNDSVRGANNLFRLGLNNAQETDTDNLKSFTSDGWTMGNDGKINQASTTYVGWSWKAGTTSGLSGGTITPSSYSINTTSKFGIYKYQGNGTSGANIAHGLGVKPAFMLIKCTSSTDDIVMYHKNLGATKHLKWRASSRSAGTSSAYWNDTEPTDTLFTIGNDSGVNTNGQTYVAYVWGEVTGYSHFSKYEGNQSSDNGPFIYTGMKPKFLIICRENSDDEIEIYDYQRAGYNGVNAHLNANLSSAEDANGGRVHMYSNGFKILTGSSGPTNSSGQTYLTMAWGQSIVGGENNIPANAR